MPERSSCRLLLLDGSTDALTYGTLTGLLDKLSPGDLLAFNNTRVVPACLLGHRASGSKIEVLVEWMFDDKRVLTHIRASKVPKPGVELLLDDDESINATVTVHHGVLFEIELNDEHPVLDILNNISHMSLPSHVNRPGEDAGRELYRTVYGKKPGAVIVPTAGLHFDEPLLEKLHAKGVKVASVTLHVGVGTFQPVRADTIEDYIMHLECAEVLQDMIDAVLTVKARGNWVIVVGTTLVRSLENAAQAVKNDFIEPFLDDIQIFIYPGSQYKVADALVTSFHLPKSTLTMLISAFAGYQRTMSVYKAVVEGKCRFFSYGGAIFITYNPRTINEHIGE